MKIENIVGRWINHKTHGKGKILEFDGRKIFVKFLNGDEFYFKYPDFNYERYFTFCTEVYNLDEDFDDDEEDEDGHTTFRRSKYWKDLYRLSLEELEIGGKNLTRSQKIILEAVRKNEKKELSRVLESGVDINERNRNGDTALIISIRDYPWLNHLLLIKSPAIDVTIRNNQNESAIMWAMQNIPNEKGVILELLNAGSEKDFSVLCWAAKIDYPEVAKYLIKNEYINLDGKSEQGYTPLMYAAIANSYNTAKILIAYGCDIFVYTKNGWNASGLAMANKSVEVRELIKKRLKESIPREFVFELEKLMPDVNCVNFFYRYAYIYFNSYAVINWLPNLNRVINGSAPLLIAQKNDMPNFYKLFKSNGAKL